MDKKEFDIRSKFTGARAFLTIPASLSMDEDLLNKPKSIILLGHIVSMLNVTQSFYMSNKAIAERLKVSKPTVSDYLNLLESKHIIIREKIIDDNSGAILGRKISAGPTLIQACSLSWEESLSGAISDPSKVDLPTPSKAGLPRGSKVDLPTLVKPTYHKEINIKDQYNIDDEEQITKIISQFKEAGLPLAYKRVTAQKQIDQLKVLLTKVDEKTVNERVKLMTESTIKTDAINYLIATLKDYLKPKKSSKKYNHNKKRVEQGTDWNKKEVERQKETAEKAKLYDEKHGKGSYAKMQKEKLARLRKQFKEMEKSKNVNY